MDTVKIYSPNQIAISSFIFGPITTIYFLWKNYLSLEQSDNASKTFLFGGLFIIFLLLVLPFLPDRFPNMVIPLTYSIAGQKLAESTQMTKNDIQESDEYDFQSNWKIFGIGALSLIVFVVLVLIELYVFVALGVVDL